MVAWRRHLHRNPEISFHEEETARFIRETLETLDGLEISRPTENSVVARLVGAGNEERGITAPHHHPRFDIDEDALGIGLKMHLAAALRLLGDERKDRS